VSPAVSMAKSEEGINSRIGEERCSLFVRRSSLRMSHEG
jgi:hypothetical protein